ncbi:helix-turn-helix domain-containing protein [Romboutsia sp. Marseille-P6047]|uniref:helix-turn-helix domain-containing protein n=1 Tax=Romboutsia sp. Marseille-P6047 TaxID=2161817 RepID=UPI000F0599D2|nr:helix-turn-helix transcriptional regulator [Romboutsia sp. Marseille-P6047]
MFNKRLKELRKKHKLTQVELAKVFNITQRALSRLENGETAATEDIINKTADYFGVSSDYLLGRTNIKNIYLYLKK